MIVPFLLALFRVAGLFAFVPVFANNAIPKNVKALLAVAVTVCLWPSIPKATVLPDNLVGLTLAVAGEMSVGLVMGLLVTMVFMGMQMGAHILTQQMGLAMGAVYDPMFDEQSTVIEQLAFWLTLVVFFAIGGQRELINALVYSYNAVPMGKAVDFTVAAEVLVGSVDSALRLATRVGVPALVVFFLSTVSLGFVSKSMPQMHLMSMGIIANLLVGMGMILLGMMGWAMLAQGAWEQVFRVMGRMFDGGMG